MPGRSQDDRHRRSCRHRRHRSTNGISFSRSRRDPLHGNGRGTNAVLSPFVIKAEVARRLTNNSIQIRKGIAMRKLWLLSLFILVSPSVGLAQSSSDYNKVEVYGGYSLGRFESNITKGTFTSSSGTQTITDLCSTATGQQIGTNSQKFFCTRRSFNGFDGSVTYNVSR